MGTAISKEVPDELLYQRKILCRLVFAGIFFFLIYYQVSNTLVHQLWSPVLKFSGVDITYWIFHLLQIPEFITHNYITGCCFDILLFTFCLLSFFFPGRRLFIILFFILYFIYYIIYNSYGTQHTHSKAGILLIPVPFMFKGSRMFPYLWEAMRYFALFVYADAFLWKLFRLAFFSKDHGILVIKKNFAAYLYNHPHSFAAEAYQWLFEHPFIINLLFKTGFLLEGFFIVGYFTRRFDKYLLLISILLPFGFLLLSDAFFFDLLVLSFTFVKIAPYDKACQIVRL